MLVMSTKEELASHLQITIKISLTAQKKECCTLILDSNLLTSILFIFTQ
jgi:hypothetical protein